MTRKEISAKYEIFIKNHRAEDFKSLTDACCQMWDYVESGVPISKRKMTHAKRVMEIQLSKWWLNGTKPWTEKDILDSLDTGKFTHKLLRWSNGIGMIESVPVGRVIERFAELSFKYNIIGVENKPGVFYIWVKESTDHQSNITGEVIEKIAKCLEF